MRNYAIDVSQINPTNRRTIQETALALVADYSLLDRELGLSVSFWTEPHICYPSSDLTHSQPGDKSSLPYILSALFHPSTGTTWQNSRKRYSQTLLNRFLPLSANAVAFALSLVGDMYDIMSARVLTHTSQPRAADVLAS